MQGLQVLSHTKRNFEEHEMKIIFQDAHFAEMAGSIAVPDSALLWTRDLETARDSQSASRKVCS